jgi:hypothetical protein
LGLLGAVTPVLWRVIERVPASKPVARRSVTWRPAGLLLGGALLTTKSSVLAPARAGAEAPPTTKGVNTGNWAVLAVPVETPFSRMSTPLLSVAQRPDRTTVSGRRPVTLKVVR